MVRGDEREEDFRRRFPTTQQVALQEHYPAFPRPRRAEHRSGKRRSLLTPTRLVGWWAGGLAAIGWLVGWLWAGWLEAGGLVGRLVVAFFFFFRSNIPFLKS